MLRTLVTFVHLIFLVCFTSDRAECSFVSQHKKILAWESFFSDSLTKNNSSLLKVWDLSCTVVGIWMALACVPCMQKVITQMWPFHCHTPCLDIHFMERVLNQKKEVFQGAWFPLYPSARNLVSVRVTRWPYTHLSMAPVPPTSALTFTLAPSHDQTKFVLNQWGLGTWPST